VTLLINYARFGSLTATGYAPQDRPFTSWSLRPLWGLLLSPYRGILVYDPLLFAGLLCLPVLLVRWRRDAILMLGIIGTSLLTYGTYFAWDAGPAWGPRYLVPMMPYLLWPLLRFGCFGAAEHPQGTIFMHGTTKRATQVATGVIAGVSVIIQALGVSMNYYVHDFYWQVGEAGQLFVPLKSSLAASPLAMSIWSLPLNLRYAFTGVLPAHGFSSADYPFGPPLPTNPHMPQALGNFYVQTFWFTLLPHPVVVATVGALIFGAGMLASAISLRRVVSIPRGSGDDTAAPAVTAQVAHIAIK
jgi:hypothetical protein